MKPITYDEIVNYKESPLLVLSGPGSGKTYLLADRVTRLLKDFSKENITVITFGKEASQNMKNMLLDSKENFKLSLSNLPNISTMHSLGNSIVIEKPRDFHLQKKNLKVQNDENIKKLLYRDASYILGFKEDDALEAIECKQKGKCIKNINNKSCKICLKYREIMSKCNYIDFDDQILFAIEILKNNPEILKKYQEKCIHLLVDEYQDINSAQFDLIELLSRESRNGLFVVGDDAQSIYKFRGCNTKYILNFKDYYPTAEVTTLTSCRRCHEKIMNDAFKILESFYPDWSGKPKLEYFIEPDEEPKIFQIPSEKSEARFVAKTALNALRDKKTVLLLVPKKEFIPTLTNELNKWNIPYCCSVNFVPERIETIKKIFNWLTNPDDNFNTRVLVEYLINHGILKIPGSNKNPKQCKKVTIDNRTNEETKIAKLWSIVKKNNSFFSSLEVEDKEEELIFKLNKVLKDLILLSKNLKGEFLEYIIGTFNIWNKPEDLKKDIIKITEMLEIKEPQVQCMVKITTMRKAKGLSFDVVIIVGLEDDVVPNPKSNLEEEARLLFVSMTRSRQKLFLIHAFKRPRNISYGEEITDKKRSRFLDILNKKSEWKKFN